MNFGRIKRINSKKLVKIIPERFSGDSELMRQGLYRIYGQSYGQEVQKLVADMKARVAFSYLAIICIILLSLVCGIVSLCFGAGSELECEEGSAMVIERPAEGEAARILSLHLKAEKNGDIVEKDVELVIKPVRNEEELLEADSEKSEDESGVTAEQEMQALERELRNVVRTINKSDEGENLTLPTSLEDGTVISWEKSGSKDFLLVLPLGMAALFFVYSNRYKPLKRKENEARASIRRELPEFMNKLVLLLNAGLVLTEGFERLALQKDSYFYKQLADINRRVRDTKAPFGQAFREFAVRSGVKELVRLSNIINDNVEKGAELVEKLRCESEMLWFARKKEAEERGRLAETKMTFPLAILLLSLVCVTVAPALMEM